MYCGKCGTKLEVGDAFCPKCGQKVGVAVRPVAQQEPQPAVRNFPDGKRPVGFRVAVIVLAALMAVETIVAGFFFPGFFNRGENGGFVGGDVVPDDTYDAKPDVTVLDLPSLEDFNIDYTDEEISNAPKSEMKISNEVRSASSGAFSVDFGDFNNMEDDTFIVRELPLHTFEDANYRVRGVDLSLASGKDRFSGEVCIKLPVSVTDGDLVQFVTKDPETGENVYEYFEMSDDGLSYLLYTTHFSTHSVVSISLFAEEFKSALKSGDTSDEKVRDALGAFYYKGLVGSVDDDIYYNPEDLWSKETAVYLPTAYEMFQQMMYAGDADNVGQNAAVTDYAGLFYYDTGIMADKVSKADAVLNAKEIGEKLSSVKIIPGVETAKTVGGKIVLDLADKAGAITTIAGFKFTLGRAINEVGDGKYDDYTSAMWGHWADNAGTAAGLVGLTGTAIAGTAAAPVTVAAALVGLGLFCYSKSIETPYDNMGETELNYRQFYVSDNAELRHVFVYDNAAEASKSDGVINIRRLDCLGSDKLNNKFKKYLSSDYFYGQDTRTGDTKINDCWMNALTALYYTLKDEPVVISDAVKEFYRNYCEAAWDYMEADKGNGYLEFSKAAMKARGSSADAARLPDDDERKAFAENMYNELLVKHRAMFLAFTKVLTHNAQRDVDEMIRKELLPLLNTKMVFTVNDSSLSDPSKFYNSRFNKEPVKLENPNDGYKYLGKYDDVRQMYQSPMEFYIKDEDEGYVPVGPPVFMPNGSGYSEGYVNEKVTILQKCDEGYFFPVKTNFWPKLISGNTVFRCTYYHYLMMGAPTAISFYDVEDENAEEKIVDFDLPKADAEGVININVTVDGPKSAAPSKTLSLALKGEDGACKYSPPTDSDKEYYTEMTANTAGGTLTLNEDGTITVSVGGIDAEWAHNAPDQNMADYISRMTYIYKREGFSLSARFVFSTEESDGTVHKVYLVYDCPSVSGTCTRVELHKTYDQEKNETFDRTLNYSETRTIASPGTGEIKKGVDVSDWSGFNEQYKGLSRITLDYDKGSDTPKLITVGIKGEFEKIYKDPNGEDRDVEKDGGLSFSFVPVK